MEERGRHYVGQKTEETTIRKWRTLTTKAEEAIKLLGHHPAREQGEEDSMVPL